MQPQKEKYHLRKFPTQEHMCNGNIKRSFPPGELFVSTYSVRKKALLFQSVIIRVGQLLGETSEKKTDHKASIRANK